MDRHFNPRARVGRDHLLGCVRALYRDFNPRARVGRDKKSAQIHCLCRISIHAPAWGATPRSSWYLLHSRDFNPRARVGRDFIPVFIAASSCYFNPRARVGRDILRHSRGCTIKDFNPRARVGRDKSRRKCWARSSHFNPRARVGRDNTTAELAAPPTISIHAPAWGATSPIKKVFYTLEFQSTRPRGARPYLENPRLL